MVAVRRMNTRQRISKIVQQRQADITWIDCRSQSREIYIVGLDYRVSNCLKGDFRGFREDTGNILL